MGSVPTCPNSLSVLQALIDAGGALVSREELRHRLWPNDTFVDFEHGVNAAVKRLREALGDSADSPQFIETIPRRGYRLIAPIDRGGSSDQRSPWAGLPRLVPVAAVLLLLVVGILWFVRPSFQVASSGAESPAGATRLTHDGGLTTQPSVTDDGETIVYASDRAGNGQLDLWLLRRGALEPVRLTADPADDSEPSISPGGDKVTFRSERDGGGIYVMPTHTGGRPTPIAADGHNPRFSPDGKYIAYWVGFTGARGDSGSPSNKVFVVSADGGRPVQLLPHFETAFWPVWSPDSKHVLVTAKSVDEFGGAPVDWYVVPVDGGPPVAVNARLLDKYKFNCLLRQEMWRGDTIVFSASQADTLRLWRTHIASGSWKLDETAEEITNGPEDHAFASGSSSDGLVFASMINKQNLWSLPVSEDGRVTGPIQRVTDDAQPEYVAGISLDGSTLAFSPASRGAWSVRLMDMKTRETRLLVPPGLLQWTILSPDGSRLAFRKMEEPGTGINVVSTHGGAPERVCANCGWNIPLGWSNDNTQLVYLTGDAGRFKIFALSLASGSQRLIAERKNLLSEGRYSPDDRWISFMEGLPTQRARIWVAPADSGGSDDGTWIPITTGESWEDKPRWSPSGTLLYFISQRDGFRCVWAQRLDGSTKRPVGAPFTVAHFHGGRVSMMNVRLAVLGFAVARDQLVFNLGEVTGNIWSAHTSHGSSADSAKP
jgi:Tol biopolymer transport system component